MDKIKKAGTSESEATRVFEEIGLGTSELRDKVLAQSAVSKPTQRTRYMIRLSNGTKPALTTG